MSIKYLNFIFYTELAAIQCLEKLIPLATANKLIGFDNEKNYDDISVLDFNLLINKEGFKCCQII